MLDIFVSSVHLIWFNSTLDFLPLPGDSSRETFERKKNPWATHSTHTLYFVRTTAPSGRSLNSTQWTYLIVCNQSGSNRNLVAECQCCDYRLWPLLRPNPKSRPLNDDLFPSSWVTLYFLEDLFCTHPVQLAAVPLSVANWSIYCLIYHFPFLSEYRLRFHSLAIRFAWMRYASSSSPTIPTSSASSYLFYRAVSFSASSQFIYNILFVQLIW